MKLGMLSLLGATTWSLTLRKLATIKFQSALERSICEGMYL